MQLNMKMLHYGKRGLCIYRESSWCEINRGLLQVIRLHVKVRILAVEFLISPTSSQLCKFDLR